MTKYEWEIELKKNLFKLPKYEQEKILEYYNELFQDKVELGRTESQIILEFGNPNDVAYKILNEYAVENPTYFSEPRTQTPPPIYTPNRREQEYYREEKPQSQPYERKPEFEERPQQASNYSKSEGSKNYQSTGKTVLFIIMVVIFGGVAIGLTVAICGLVVAYFGVIIAFMLGGVGSVIMSFFEISTSIAGFLTTLGGGIVLLGLGNIVIAFSKPLVRLFVKCIKLIYNVFFGWYFKKKGEIL